MKKIIYFLLLSSAFTFAQTVKGVITLKPTKGIGDDTKLSKKAKKPMYYGYTYSGNKSLQELISNESTTIDTTYITDDRIKDEKFETTQTNIRPHKIYHYKNFNSNIYRLEVSVKDANFVNTDTSIKDSIPSYEWELKNETQTIAGFTCKKATTIKKVGSRTLNILAWYCEDIPINDGPMDYSGLPGLILQVEVDKNTIIKFEKLKYIKDEVIKIKEPKNKVEMLTIKQYIKKMMNGG